MEEHHYQTATAHQSTQTQNSSEVKHFMDLFKMKNVCNCLLNHRQICQQSSQKLIWSASVIKASFASLKQNFYTNQCHKKRSNFRMCMQSTLNSEEADHKRFMKVWHLPTTCIGNWYTRSLLNWYSNTQFVIYWHSWLTRKWEKIFFP